MRPPSLAFRVHCSGQTEGTQNQQRAPLEEVLKYVLPSVLPLFEFEIIS